MSRRRIRTGDIIQVSIVGWTALCDETKSGHVILRSHITGRVKVIRVDTSYVLLNEGPR